jgi:hypothetical protein
MSTGGLSPTAVLRALQEESAKLAAPNAAAPTPPPDPGGGGLAGDVQGSWGWSFLFGMGFLLVVYCIVGCCRGSAHGRSGLAAMPHADFWRSLPQLVGDGVRFAMGEENPDPRDRTIAGIAGQDDEYYAGDQRDSAEYEPISGGTVRSHSSPLLDLLFVWSDCWRVRCDSGVCLVIMRAKGALRTPRTAQTVDR